MAQMEARLASLDKALQEIRGKPSGGPRAELDPADRHAIEESKERERQLGVRMAALEGVILTDPVKALSLPLLRKDFDALQDRQKADADAIRGELGRLYSFAQWFMGLMITIALALFTLAIGNLRRESDKKEEPAAKTA
jgi:hypothetical protein